MVMSLLESLYKSLYKNVKDSALSIFRSPWRPEKSCVFAATVLDPSDTQRQTRTGRPFSCLYRTRPAAFCPYPGGLNFGIRVRFIFDSPARCGTHQVYSRPRPLERRGVSRTRPRWHVTPT